MTLKEADEAAQKRLPVIHKDIEYVRITQTGYNYDEKGKRSGFVQLLDKYRRKNKSRRKTMKRELCVPCAAKLADTNEVKKTGYRRGKITCSECQRRRYGGEYEVSQKAEKGAKNDTTPE